MLAAVYDYWYGNHAAETPIADACRVEESEEEKEEEEVKQPPPQRLPRALSSPPEAPPLALGRNAPTATFVQQCLAVAFNHGSNNGNNSDNSSKKTSTAPPPQFAASLEVILRARKNLRKASRPRAIPVRNSLRSSSSHKGGGHLVLQELLLKHGHDVVHAP